MLRLRPTLAAALLGLLVLAAPAEGRPGQALTPPAGKGLSLDGAMDEAAWKDAARLPLPAVRAPTYDGLKTLTPDVRLLSSAGRLWIGVRLQEDVGSPIGLHVLVAPDGTKSAGDAVSIDYRPHEIRAVRYHVVGPKGVGRGHYRLEGKTNIAQGSWSLELSVPWADLAPTKDRALRMALVVYTRTPNVISRWPAGAAWHGPAKWAEIAPPSAGWELDVSVDAKRIAAEDAVDAQRRALWLKYLTGVSTPIPHTWPREKVVAAITDTMITPLDEIGKLQPDLLVPALCLKGDVYHRLGMRDLALASYVAAQKAQRGWREAAYGVHVKVRGPNLAEDTVGGPSDFAAQRKQLAALRAVADLTVPGPALDGLDLAEALLDYKQGRGDFGEKALQRLGKRYAFDAFIVAHARFATAGKRAAAEEAFRAKRSVEQKLPRAEVKTTRGTFVIEMFPKDAPNTVKNFVYLARTKSFYDGLAVHRTVPFFLAQMGDPNSREGSKDAEHVGSGNAGYSIRSEPSPRRMVRGAVVMASAGRNTEGSQFYVLTGTAMHLQGEQTVFGRVLSGMDVVDQLRRGDRIVSVTCRDLDPKVRYVPITVSGGEPK